MASVFYRRFGVYLKVAAPDSIFSQIEPYLPIQPPTLPLSRPSPNEADGLAEAREYSIIESGANRYDLTIASEPTVADKPLATIIRRLEADAKYWVSATNPHVVFVHAGAIGVGDGVVLLPGVSHAGKSSLVAALLSAGATYYSDDFAVIDPDGSLWPFPLPLAMRTPEGRETVRAESLNAAVAAGPGKVRGVVVTHFQPGVAFTPQSLSRGNIVLRLAEHAPAIQLRPRDVLSALGAATRVATGYQSARGEAKVVADWIMATYS